MATPPRPNFNLDNVVAPDVGGSLIDFANMQSKQFQLGLSNVREEAQARRANEQAEREKINFDRLERERQASDLFNQELLKGKQIHGGILNTDELISEADKYAFTPEEMVKYDTYKGDEAAARKAGDIALADKIAWQTRVSDFANSGSDKLKESRVQMLERVLGNISSKGLPIPAELVAGTEQARLSEETVNKEARKDIDEKISKLTESLNKDQKWAIGSLGASQYTDEDGVTHNIGGSTGSSSSEVRANNTNVGQGNKLLMTAIDGLKLSDKDAKLDATAKALELTSILKEQGIPFDDAAAMVANGLYSKEQNPVLSWIGFGKKGAAINQEAIDLFAANALKQYQQTSSSTGGTGGKSGISDKASAAIDYFQNQRDSVSTQLAKLYKEKALLEGTAEDRQTASLNRLLQSKGILEAPLSEQLASKPKAGSAGKNLNAPDPDAVVKPTVNRNIKSIAGIPDSLVAAEGVTNKSYKLKGENAYTVGMGYNLGKNDISKDFSDANIPSWKAEIAKNNPENLVLTDGEASRLAQVAYYSRIDALDRIIGGNFDKLSPEMQGTAMQMMYRGDLGNTAHGKIFKKLIAADDYKGLTEYITANAKNLPAPVVRRFNLDLGMPNKEKLRGDSFMKSNDEKTAHLKKALESSSTVKDLFNKVSTEKVDNSSPVFAPTSQELINSDDRLLQLKEEARNHIKGSPEYNKVQSEYDNRLKDLRDRGAGGDLAAYMTRHKSGPRAEAINKEITDILKSGTKIPEKVVDFVRKGEGSIVDFQRMLMEDANKGKDYIKILMDRLNRPGLEGKIVNIPDRPDWYKQ